MRRIRIVLLIPALGTGCFDAPPGDLEDPSSDGSTQASSTGEATGSDTSPGSSSTGDSSSVADTTGEPTVAVRGKVVGRWGDASSAAIAGVKVEVLGTPGLSDVTDDQGVFELLGVTPGAPVHLAARPSSIYLGGIIGVDVTYQDLEDVVLLRPARLDVQQLSDQLVEQDASAAIDPAQGGVFAISTRQGTTVTLTPASGRHYALDADGVPQLDSAETANFLIPMVAFYGIGAHAAGELELGATHPETACTVPLPHPPVEPDHMTVVTIDCG